MFDKEQYESELAKLEKWVELSYMLERFCGKLTDPMISVRKPDGIRVHIKHVFPEWADKIITTVRKELQIAEDKILLFEPFVVPKALNGKVQQPFCVLIEEQDVNEDYPLFGKASNPSGR